MNLSFGSPPQTRRLPNRRAELLPYVFNKWGHNAPRLRTRTSGQLDQAAVYGKWNAGSNGTRFLFRGDVESKAREAGKSSCLAALFGKFKPRPSTRVLVGHACCINCARTFLWKCADWRSQVLHHKFFIFSEGDFKLV
jgi:hypothetical protein